jgi:aspartyl/glutamyl-tRNA(Asn/Gln) amidotransferase C subunit
MSTLDLKAVQRLAKLSNLKLTDEEAAQYPEQLSESLEYVKNLDEIDTGNVPDNFYTTNAHNVMEEDEVDEGIMLSHEDAIKNAKATKKGYFVVKRIL